MLFFDPSDPFPLLAPGISYAEEKVHSEAVDAWLGMNVAEAESRIGLSSDNQERWVAQGPAVFLTPYSELRKILTELAPQGEQLIVDLGAGYGRMGFVLERHFPGVRFLGYELVSERVEAGARVLQARACKNSQLLCLDLLKNAPEAADFYFLYDYGTRDSIEKTLGDLRAIAQKQKIVLVGRGRAVRDAVERRHPWLGAVVEPVHHKNYSIYRSREG